MAIQLTAAYVSTLQLRRHTEEADDIRWKSVNVKLIDTQIDVFGKEKPKKKDKFEKFVFYNNAICFII